MLTDEGPYVEYTVKMRLTAKNTIPHSGFGTKEGPYGDILKITSSYWKKFSCNPNGTAISTK